MLLSTCIDTHNYPFHSFTKVFIDSISVFLDGKVLSIGVNLSVAPSPSFVKALLKPNDWYLLAQSHFDRKGNKKLLLRKLGGWILVHLPNLHQSVE